jgi:ABC-type transport system substrate-binding protein
VIRDTWDPIAGGQAIPIIQGQRQLVPQFRDPTAPWARDVRVREAMAYMLDRQAMADILQQGFTVPADAFITPKDQTWPLLEQRGFKRRPHDLPEAQRLMGAAGWTRGSDGVYRDSGGQTLPMEVRGGSGFTQELTVVAAQWKDAGLDSSIFVIPDTTANERELQNASRGVQASSGGDYLAYTEAAIGTADNRWQGANRGAYRNPTMERLGQEWTASTFDVPKRLGLQADILKLLHDDVAYIPLYYNVRGQAWSKAVRGPGPFETPLTLQSLWNVHEWEML